MKRIFIFAFLAFCLSPFHQTMAQITGKFGTYYDQRELLFEAMPTSENDIIFLGNSITDGGEWCELFENPNCKNRGISGDKCPGVLNRLSTITKGKPAMVFLMIGVNDMGAGVASDTIAENIRTIVQRIKAESPRTKVFVQSVLPTSDYYGMFNGHTSRWQQVAEINALLQGVAQDEQVRYVDLYSHFATSEGKMNPQYSNDGLHINGEGYKLWRQVIEDEIGNLPQSQKAPLTVNLKSGMGLGVVHSFDAGLSPLEYMGIAANLNFGLSFEWDRYLIEAEARAVGSIVGAGKSLDAYDFDAGGKAEFLYRFKDSDNNRWHFYGGGALLYFQNIKLMPNMMNCALSINSFATLNASGMAQYDFHFVEGRNKYTAFAKVMLPLGGALYRPSYTVVVNGPEYVFEENEEHVLEDYIRFGEWFPGVSTDMGIMLNLKNNNHIVLSYRWDYYTTRNNGFYRFDNATHFLNLSFLFNLQ